MLELCARHHGRCSVRPPSAGPAATRASFFVFYFLEVISPLSFRLQALACHPSPHSERGAETTHPVPPHFPLQAAEMVLPSIAGTALGQPGGSGVQVGFGWVFGWTGV